MISLGLLGIILALHYGKSISYFDLDIGAVFLRELPFRSFDVKKPSAL